MRGKDQLHLHQRGDQGITPAYAGKSQHVNGYRIEKKDHPRVCGEKDSPAAITFHCKGSPPRMRGKADQVYGSRSKAGITPAYAGKRPEPSARRTHCQDHPRVCGEKPFRNPVRSIGLGSPPRMRGKATLVGAVTLFTRITPAYAGKRYANCRAIRASTDHPRVCGEKAQALDVHLQRGGSPPRMRGKD